MFCIKQQVPSIVVILFIQYKSKTFLLHVMNREVIPGRQEGLTVFSINCQGVGRAHVRAEADRCG